MKLQRVAASATMLAIAAAAGCNSGDSATDGGANDAASGSDSSMATGDGAAADSPVMDRSVAATDAADAAATDGPGEARATDGSDGAMPMCGPFANGASGPPDAGPLPVATMSFFVSSAKSMTGNLGGLAGADARCQGLATAVGLGAKTWHAYLSVEHDAADGGAPTNARDRIGAGPWYNARGVMLAATLTDLHARKGDPAVFIDEHGGLINGQWTMSPGPNEHDIMTGSNADGTVAPGKTCVDWTSAAGAADSGVPEGGSFPVARVGHSDGFGPTCATPTTPNDLTSWNSAHDNAGCDNTAPRGGAGRIYCFAIN